MSVTISGESSPPWNWRPRWASLPKILLISAAASRSPRFPFSNELYFTHNKNKAFLNGKPLSSSDALLENSIVSASFNSQPDRNVDEYELFGLVSQNSRSILRLGSAARNICWIAEGKIGAGYGLRAKIWDVAAGLAIARAAGCSLAVNWNFEKMEVDYVVGKKTAVTQILEIMNSKFIQFQEHNLWKTHQ